MSDLKPRLVCDLCRLGDGDATCYAGGADKCLKDGHYTKYQPRRATQDPKRPSEEDIGHENSHGVDPKQ